MHGGDSMQAWEVCQGLQRAAVSGTGTKDMGYLTTGLGTTVMHRVFLILRASRSMSVKYDIYF